MQDERVSNKKLQIVKRAYESFYDGGFHATGVDAVMADTGISKRTLYKYFGSKEELIQAVLDYYGTQIVEELFKPAQSAGKEPLEQVLVLFDMREQMIANRPIRGCLGIKASQEYLGKDDKIASSGRAYAEFVEKNFVRLCEEAGLADPSRIGKEISILFQGAVLLSQVYGNPSPFEAAKAATLALLKSANPAMQAQPGTSSSPDH